MIALISEIVAVIFSYSFPPTRTTGIVNEKVVQESLETLAADRTTFVIAHRLSTIRNAERILVLTEDGIAESGTHKELMEKQGVYYKLYNIATGA